MIKASLILAGTLCLVSLLRRRSAAERHMLWAAAIGSAAILPLLGVLVPTWEIDVIARVAAALPTLSDTSRYPGPGPGADIVVRAEAIQQNVPALDNVLWALWVAGSGVFLLVLAAGTGRLAWLGFRARPIFDPEWREMAAAVSKAVGLSRPVRLLQSPDRTMPITWGVFRPRVLLPSCAGEWSEDRKRVVLAHELAHVRRLDWVFQILSELACAAFWFNPLFWVACSRLRRESEQACDDAVLNLGVDGEDYAAHLFEIARRLNASDRLWSPALTMARQSNLETRFAAMLNTTLNRAPVTRKAGLAVVIATLLFVFPVAAMRAPHGDSTMLASEPPGGLPAVTGADAARPDETEAVSDAVTPPAVAEYTMPPLYSDEARRRRIEGIVRVAIWVDATGKAEVLRVEQGLGFGLDQNAILAARNWRFSPGARNGSPIAMKTSIAVEFNLRNEELNELIANDMAVRVGRDVTPPSIIHRVRAQYPERARRRGLVGTVVLDLLILENGSPRILRVVQALDPELDDNAVQALEQWRFSPAMKDGVPVKVRMNAEVKF